MNPDKLFYYLSLIQVPKVGDFKAKNLIQYFGDPEAIFKEKQSSLAKVANIGPHVSRAIKSFKDFDRVHAELDYCIKNGISIKAYDQKDYPNRLKHCADSPVVLFTKGADPVELPKTLAIVGTRSMTQRMDRILESWIQVWAEAGISVISGLAYGVDKAAHQYSLKYGISNYAVMGNGMDKVYPAAHRKLAAKILEHENSGLITENWSNTEINPENFPRRNRIIAGMADVVLVAEAALTGGALITAKYAFEYNRDIMAIPGAPHETFSLGCNKLIRTQVARLIDSPEQLIEWMGWEVTGNKKQTQVCFPEDLEEDYIAVIKAVQKLQQPTLDELAVVLGWPVSKTSAKLLELELKGLLVSLPGRKYKLA